MTKAAEWQLALPLALCFVSLFLAPLLLLIGVSFFDDDKITQPGFGQWVKFFGDPFSYKVIVDTLLLGLKTVCATVLLGYPLALVYLDAPPRLQKVLIFIIVMPLLPSVVVRTFAWIVMLGRDGVINQLLLGLGIISRAVEAPADRTWPRDLAHPDRNAVDASAADQRHVAARSRICATLQRHSAPRAGARFYGDRAAQHAGAGRGLPAGVRQLDDGVHLADRDRRRAADLPAPPHLAAVPGRLQLALRGRGLDCLAGLRAHGGECAFLARPALQRASPRVDNTGRQRSLADLSYILVIGTLALLALLIIVVPVVIVLTTSFTEGRSLKFPPTGFSLQWYAELFDPVKSRQIHRAVYNSLEVAAWSTALGVLLGSMAALGLARSRHKLARVGDSFFMSPLVLPGLTFGLAALMYFTLIGLRPSLNLIIAGHMIVTVPFILRTTTASISQLDPALNDSSQSLGASWISTPCAA